jgi:hypothetical protein
MDRSKYSSGRPAIDHRGNAVWEWRKEDGTFSIDVETNCVKALQETHLAIEEPKPPRRTLDDMRRLSEEIRRRKAADPGAVPHSPADQADTDEVWKNVR